MDLTASLLILFLAFAFLIHSIFFYLLVSNLSHRIIVLQLEVERLKSVLETPSTTNFAEEEREFLEEARRWVRR